MSNDATIKSLGVYEEIAPATMFLTGFFEPSFYTQEFPDIDIVRYNEDIAIVIQDLSTGNRIKSADLYTNKVFKAPVLSEEFDINSWSLIKRQAGNNPYADLDYNAAATKIALAGVAECEKRIKRTVELEASQVLQTGKLDLIDKNGVSLYVIDYSPKTAHFPTAVITWDNIATAVPMADIELVADLVRDDSKQEADTLIFGNEAWGWFRDNAKVRDVLDNRRITVGNITPAAPNGVGGKYQGQITIGNYMFDMWTYNGRYKHPQTGVSTKYVDSKKVIIKSSTGRLDATYGDIPAFGNPAGGIVPWLPERLGRTAGDLQLRLAAWLSNNRRQLTVEAAIRPLLIPTAIDSFGCITTK